MPRKCSKAENKSCLLLIAIACMYGVSVQHNVYIYIYLVFCSYTRISISLCRLGGTTTIEFAQAKLWRQLTKELLTIIKTGCISSNRYAKSAVICKSDIKYGVAETLVLVRYLAGIYGYNLYAVIYISEGHHKELIRVYTIRPRQREKNWFIFIDWGQEEKHS